MKLIDNCHELHEFARIGLVAIRVIRGKNITPTWLV
jgi:hypothetical protein